MPKGIYKRKIKSIEERFWKKVNKSRKCWEWTACRNERGYGQIRIGRRAVLAHRVSWIIHFGGLSPYIDSLISLCVLHKCDNPRCVNPSHLFLGTQQDNVVDKVKKGRQSSPHGEESHLSKLTEEEVNKIRELYKVGTSHKTIAKKFNISESNVGAIIRRETWTHI